MSLRDPLEHCLSAYANKRADGTVHRHLLKNLHRAWSVDQRKDGEVEASFFKGKDNKEKKEKEGRRGVGLFRAQAAERKAARPRPAASAIDCGGGGGGGVRGVA